jgi:hypothetical protein
VVTRGGVGQYKGKRYIRAMLQDFSESDVSSGDEADQKRREEQVKKKPLAISYNDLQAHGFRGPSVLELPEPKIEEPQVRLECRVGYAQ